MATLETLAPLTLDGMGAEAPVSPYDLTEENKGRALALVRDKLALWTTGGRDAIVRNAWRNILFKRGHQWLVYDRGRAWWRPIDATKYTGPRPVTNMFAAHMNAFTSTLARIEPVLTFRPATDDPEDRATAAVADRVIEVCEAECNVVLQRQLLAEWVGYTGGAWLESGYDPSDEHGTRLVQHAQCPACGAVGLPTAEGLCAACGGPTTPAVDAQGAPIGQDAPIGKLYTEVCTLFEMYFDAAETDWTRVREYARKKSRDKDALVRQWGEAAEGVTADLGLTMGEAYQEQLPLLASYQPETGPGAGLGPPRRGAAAGGRVSETYYWSKPTPDYPEGLLAIILGGSTVVYLGPLPYRDDRGPILPTVYFPIDPVPGSLYSKTPADDLALKQVQRNQLEAHLIMTMNRMAWPIWLMPEGTNIAGFHGEPGFILRYNALGPNAAKPERLQGSGLPNGAITWLQYLDHDFEELSAAYAGTKGDRQAGVSAGIALQMIEERKNQRFGPMYILWGQAWAEWARQQLAIFRQFVTEPRALKIQGRGSRWRVEQFLGADLTGRLDVVPEADAGAPRSSLVERAELEQLMALGVLNSRDPDTQVKILEAYHRSSWLPGLQADTEMAAKQLALFESLAVDAPTVARLTALLQQAQAQHAQAQQAAQQQAATMGRPMAPLPPVTYDQLVPMLAQQGVAVPKIRPAVDGHQIFAREFATWLKGDASQGLPEAVQVLVEMKHAEHTQLGQQQAMQAMQMQQGTFPTSGFLSNPGGQQGPTAGPPAGPASRMDGEFREQTERASA